MKLLTQILFTIIMGSCNNSTPETANVSRSDGAIAEDQDSILSMPVIKNVTDSSIVNTSNKTVDILFNGINNYLGGQRNPNLHFATECMICEHVQVYGEGLLFGKRLYISKDSVIIYKTDRNISDTTDIVKMVSYYGEKKVKRNKFSQGILTMKYHGQSCIDADFVSVNLSYDKHAIELDKLINASFFEYDLDKNGIKEQYLLGTRNCSQELVLIRINNTN